MIALLAVAALAVFKPDTEALLRVALDGPTMVVSIATAPEPVGRRLTIDCVAGCTRKVHYVEAVGDTSLGLFQPFDAQPIVLSVWAGGSAYHVRGYRLTADGVTRVLDAATRSAPGVRVDQSGAIVVTTTERNETAAPNDAPTRIEWTLRGTSFVRSEATSPAGKR